MRGLALALSVRNLRVLECIDSFIVDKGYSPTVREIGDDAGLRSPSSVHNHLQQLARFGLLTYEPGKVRTITITDEGLGVLYGGEHDLGERGGS